MEVDFMIIQHNISALNSYNKLAGNNKALAKNLEKLSSGYKINRAADDAAGLGISEKMRAQITGMNRAQQNSKDGISLVQTAEGALTEVHSMLNRMVDLTTQASNGIYTDTERTKIQDELKQLESEIDRIADATNFNGIKLLDGSMGASKSYSTSAAKTVLDVSDNLEVKTIDAQQGKAVFTNTTNVTNLDAEGAKNFSIKPIPYFKNIQQLIHFGASPFYMSFPSSPTCNSPINCYPVIPLTI